MRFSNLRFLSMLVAVCVIEPDGAHAQQTSDSAGIPVTLNRARSASGTGNWALAAQPTVELGVASGAPEYELFRVFDGAVLTDGTIVIANAGTFQLRFYDSGGRHLRSAGREGAAPGEFQSLALAGVFDGDSLLTYDMSQRRASVFAPDGTFTRSFSVPVSLEGTATRPAGVLSDGSLVLVRLSIPTDRTPLHRIPNAIDVVPSRGGAPISLGVFGGAEQLRFRLRDGYGGVWGVPFGPAVSYAAARDRIVVATTEAFSLRVYDSGGRALRVIRQQGAPRALHPREFDRVRASTLANRPPDQRMMLEQVFEQLPRHPTLPFFDELLIDRVGNAWVRDYALESDVSHTWQVFDRDGRLIAAIQTPSSLRILDVGADYMLATTTDELGVERVRKYELRKR